MFSEVYVMFFLEQINGDGDRDRFGRRVFAVAGHRPSAFEPVARYYTSQLQHIGLFQTTEVSTGFPVSGGI